MLSRKTINNMPMNLHNGPLANHTVTGMCAAHGLPHPLTNNRNQCEYRLRRWLMAVRHVLPVLDSFVCPVCLVLCGPESIVTVCRAGKHHLCGDCAINLCKHTAGAAVQVCPVCRGSLCVQRPALCIRDALYTMLPADLCERLDELRPQFKAFVATRERATSSTANNSDAYALLPAYAAALP